MGGVGVVWMGKSAEKKCTDIDVSCARIQQSYYHLRSTFPFRD